ncbi:MAG TPA: hypothetical protein VKD72_21605 [Gemmataceae bacterium]|nr:hypothetical protein [Gemmataceae bacterium]
MGYSTALYAVDLDKLKAAVGSGDARLIRRLLPAGKAKGGKKGKKAILRVLLNNQSELFLNREPVSFEGLMAELSRPKWKGSYLFFHETDGRRTGRWRKEDSLLWAILNGLPSHDFLDYQCCFTLKELYRGAEADDEISVAEAAADLVEGAVSRPRFAYQYGYGVERLCAVLGTRLTAIEGKGGMLKALKLDTPLSRERSPVPLPKSREDFPGIGYLTAAEVKREVDRLGAMDLSFPTDELIEADRKELLRSLQKAAKKQVGVVAFYY